MGERLGHNGPCFDVVSSLGWESRHWSLIGAQRYRDSGRELGEDWQIYEVPNAQAPLTMKLSPGVIRG